MSGVVRRRGAARELIKAMSSPLRVRPLSFVASHRRSRYYYHYITFLASRSFRTQLLPLPLAGMPFLRYSTSSHVHQEDATLKINLHIGHILRLGNDNGSQQCYNLKQPPPISVDVFSHSDLTFILSVTLDGRRLTINSIRRSLVSQHFVEMLRKVR